MRDDDYKRAVEEAAKHGARIDFRLHKDVDTDFWRPVVKASDPDSLHWHLADYRVAPEPDSVRVSPCAGFCYGPPARKEMTLFQVAPQLWVQVDGWQYPHQAKITVCCS